MKYIILTFAMLLSISWNLFQSTYAKKEQHTEIQIHGKVQGLYGKVILNIDDNYLTITADDRFTFLTEAVTKKQLTMQVLAQPEGQTCEIVKTTESSKHININVSCQTMSGAIPKNYIAVL